jgi:MFS transporter, FSR family, fosmidomycin resistance protein
MNSTRILKEGSLNASFPWTFGIIHAITDAASVAAIFRAIAAHDPGHASAFYLVVLYNLVAFAGQVPAGFLIDRLRLSRHAAASGVLLSACALMAVKANPFLCVLLAGTGNALYHVGGGLLSLHVRKGRATAPGIFVAPGDIGLFLGLWTGAHTGFPAWPLLLLCAVSFAVTIAHPLPAIPHVERSIRPGTRFPLLIICLLLLSVGVRSFVGLGGTYASPSLPFLPMVFAIVAVGGKALGGVFADRYGWLPVGVGALLLSAPMVAFGGRDPVVLTAGLFLFQFTMPVTLVATAAVLDGMPALSFGLCAFALFAGALPTFYTEVNVFYGPALFFTLIMLSAAALFIGLVLLKRSGVAMKFGAGKE